MVDVEAWELRGRIALAYAAKRERVSRRHLQEALVCAQRLDASGRVGRAYALLLRAGVANVLGQSKNAVKLLCDAVDACDEAGVQLYHHVACRRLGQILGEPERIRAADDGMREVGISDPARMAAMLAPGWADPGELSKAS